MKIFFLSIAEFILLTSASLELFIKFHPSFYNNYAEFALCVAMLFSGITIYAAISTNKKNKDSSKTIFRDDTKKIYDKASIFIYSAFGALSMFQVLINFNIIKLEENITVYVFLFLFTFLVIFSARRALLLINLFGRH